MPDTTNTLAAAPVKAGKIWGLDAIRFVCAFWVVLGHYDLPIPFGHGQSSHLLRILDGGLHAAFVGVAAVMVFFVISGFCIRYPFRHGESPAWGEYFLRRYLRIGLPLGAAVLLVRLVGPTPTFWENSVLWSLYAEIIYYTAYPLLMWAQRRVGWNALLATAYGAALLVVLRDPHASIYAAYGLGLNWVVGLPCWLLGCRLADQADVLSGTRVPTIWLWRLGVWAGSVLCSVLRFHGNIGYPLTLDVFAVLVFFWLRQEIRQFRYQKPPAFLERAGGWSYSLYLMHFPALWAFGTLGLSRLPLPGAVLWLMQIVLALLTAYVFYTLVERPSHWLARQFKRRQGDKPASFAPASGESQPVLATPGTGRQD